jgi:hypothetical protein
VFSLTHWVLLALYAMHWGQLALLVLGVCFWKTRKYVPFEKYKNKASGAREKVFLSPAPAKPLFLTHWVPLFPGIPRLSSITRLNP